MTMKRSKLGFEEPISFAKSPTSSRRKNLVVSACDVYFALYYRVFFATTLGRRQVRSRRFFAVWLEFFPRGVGVPRFPGGLVAHSRKNRRNS